MGLPGWRCRWWLFDYSPDEGGDPADDRAAEEEVEQEDGEGVGVAQPDDGGQEKSQPERDSEQAARQQRGDVLQDAFRVIAVQDNAEGRGDVTGEGAQNRGMETVDFHKGLKLQANSALQESKLQV